MAARRSGERCGQRSMSSVSSGCVSTIGAKQDAKSLGGALLSAAVEIRCEDSPPDAESGVPFCAPEPPALAAPASARNS
jgi:hypothetical protein